MRLGPRDSGVDLRVTEPGRLDRREFLRGAAGLALLASTGSLFADCPPTPRNVAGPFWREGAPFRSRLWTDEAGDLLTITGKVVDSHCRPIPGAVLDLWQADGNGRYDSELTRYDAQLFRLRGRAKTDARGEYRIETVRPAPYGMGASMRPAHIHAIVSAPGKTNLVTQMYFHDDPYLRTDPLRQVRDPLIVHLQEPSPGAAMPRARRRFGGTFNIALSA